MNQRIRGIAFSERALNASQEMFSDYQRRIGENLSAFFLIMNVLGQRVIHHQDGNRIRRGTE